MAAKVERDSYYLLLGWNSCSLRICDVDNDIKFDHHAAGDDQIKFGADFLWSDAFEH